MRSQVAKVTQYLITFGKINDHGLVGIIEYEMKVE